MTRYKAKHHIPMLLKKAKPTGSRNRSNNTARVW